MKKNVFKKLNALIICIMFIVVSGNTVLASEQPTLEKSPTLEEMKNYLLSIGTEQEFLNDITDNRIEKIYEICKGKDVRFAGYETEIVEIQGGDPRLRNQIATNELKLGVGVYEFTSGGKITGLNVSTTYQWLKDTFFHRTDAHTLNFDGEKFKFGGIYAESGYTMSNQFLHIDSVDAPATAADGGIGWYLSIAKGNLPKSLLNHGGADIYLIPRNGSATKAQLSSSIYYKYAHCRFAGSLSFGVSGPSITIASGSYDSQTKVYNY